MNSGIRAILWDVGGTLAILKSPSPVGSVARTIQRCNIDPTLIPAERIIRTHAAHLANERSWRTLDDEHQDRQIWAAALLEGSGAADNARDALSIELRKYYDIYQPVPGIFQLLADLRRRGFRQAVVSNWPPSLPLFLEHHGLAKFFDAIVFSAEDGVHKPDLRIFQRALSLVGAAPREAIMIGDDPSLDIEAANRVGMRSIHFDPRRQHVNREADDVSALRVLLDEIVTPASPPAPARRTRE